MFRVVSVTRDHLGLGTKLRDEILAWGSPVMLAARGAARMLI